MNALLLTGTAVAAAGILADISGRTRRWLHIFQLEHYEAARLIMWWRRRPDLRHPLQLATSVAALAGAATCLVIGREEVASLLLVAIGVVSFPIAYLEWRRPEKRPFVFTGRARRVFIVSLVPALLFLLATAGVVAADAVSASAITALTAIGLALVAAAPLSLAAADLALSPAQKRINRRYVGAARAKLAAIRPLTVGITGSYGKTTTKFCVGAVLSRLGETLVTPESFNSYLGVTRTVNERLRSDHRFFVVEMGAYRRGDIAGLCELTTPRVGIVTAIGPMHLERFGSIEAIRDTKAELVASLPSYGHFITNGDDPRCRSIADAATVPVTLFALDADDAEVRASDVRISSGTTCFTLHLCERSYPVRARLLGRHNVRNLLAAAACGLVAGVADEQIVSALEAVEPPPHRLAAIVNPRTGVVVIDDAYNSNPEGAAGALEVLAEHDANRRLLVTPGMVELGPGQETANVELGQRAARVCDLVLLVGGEQTEPIERGLLDAGLNRTQIIVARDIDHATEELSRIVQPGDVVLFENDLPDTYVRNGPMQGVQRAPRLRRPPGTRVAH